MNALSCGASLPHFLSSERVNHICGSSVASSNNGSNLRRNYKAVNVLA